MPLAVGILELKQASLSVARASQRDRLGTLRTAYRATNRHPDEHKGKGGGRAVEGQRKGTYAGGCWMRDEGRIACAGLIGGHQ